MRFGLFEDLEQHFLISFGGFARAQSVCGREEHHGCFDKLSAYRIADCSITLSLITVRDWSAKALSKGGIEHAASAVQHRLMTTMTARNHALARVAGILGVDTCLISTAVTFGKCVMREKKVKTLFIVSFETQSPRLIVRAGCRALRGGGTR